MKIAFVNQAIDTIVPPFQTSVGACTYGAACALPKSCKIIVYGTRDRNRDYTFESPGQNIQLRFFALSFSDRLSAKIRNEYTKLFPAKSPASSSSWLFRAYGHQVAKDLRGEGCDVIHLQHCSQYLPVIRAFNPAAKIVLHLHAEWFSQNNLSEMGRRLRHVDLLTTVSDHITSKTCRQFPAIAGRCQTMYNGIDAEEFTRERVSTCRKTKRILYAGALSPHKGVHVLLEAFALVVKQYPDIELDLVGLQGCYPLAESFDMQDLELMKSVSPFYTRDRISRLKAKLSLAAREAGTYLSQLKERIPPEANGKVAFLGFVPRPALLDLYYGADIFVFPPIWDEGFGIPPVEAMAAGVPVVATHSGAIPETVIDGQTGLLVAKNNPHELAQAILTLLRDDQLRETMGKASRARAHGHFTWNQVARKMYSRYAELCDEDLPQIGVFPLSIKPA